ncbi:MAG: DedA family protein [Gemmatimonadetes bacterium]|nr:DedA family protein [Gemmatimonadota bacterium]
MFDWIVNVVRSLGYPGVALLTFLENLVPPIPSELVMPLAGFIAARDGFTVWGAIAAGTGGSLAGAVGWYVIGRRVGEERVRAFFRRHGRWVGLTGEDIDRSMKWFRRRGGVAVLVGRLVPAIRTFISLPAGFAGMPFLPFLLYTLVGTAAWTAALTYAGVFLGRNYDAVQDYLSPATWVVIGGIVAWYLYKVITYDSAADRERTA